MSADEERNDNTNTANLAEPLSFSMPDVDVEFMASSTYAKGVTNEKTAKIIHIAGGFLETQACVIPNHSAFILPK